MVSAVPASKNYNGSNRSSLVQAGTRAINAFGAFFAEEALGKGPPFFTKNLAAEVTRTLVALCSAEAFGQSTPEGTLTSIAGHGHAGTPAAHRGKTNCCCCRRPVYHTCTTRRNKWVASPRYPGTRTPKLAS